MSSSVIGREAAAAIEAGEALLAQGRPLDALQIFDRAVALAPTIARAQFGRGVALKSARRLDEALAAFAAAAALDPEDAAAQTNRAAILVQQGQYPEALTACELALGRDPRFAPAHCNRGLALAGLDRLEEALVCYDAAIASEPNYVAALGNRAKALQLLNRPEEALASYQRVLELQPTLAQAHVNASHTLLTLGRLAEGWAGYEWRKRLAVPLGARQFDCPSWSGRTTLQDKTLLIHWEQGLGDTIQFCRYGKLAAAAGANVMLLVQRNLGRLLRTLAPEVTVVDEDRLPAHLDFHCPLLSLPLAFGTVLETIPAEVPYLRAESERVAYWREKIGTAGFKIGINWQGNIRSPADRGRSFAARHFLRLAAIPGVRLISLQLDGPVDAPIETLGAQFDRGPDAFVDCAAVMECLDLIITSDTSVAHLAGALARPTWVALMQVADWRWLSARTDSPWYPTLRLFRQAERGRWDLVFDEIYAALLARVTENAAG